MNITLENLPNTTKAVNSKLRSLENLKGLSEDLQYSVFLQLCATEQKNRLKILPDEKTFHVFASLALIYANTLVEAAHFYEINLSENEVKILVSVELQEQTFEFLHDALYKLTEEAKPDVVEVWTLLNGMICCSTPFFAEDSNFFTFMEDFWSIAEKGESL